MKPRRKKRTLKAKLEFGRLWETVQETRDHIERRDGVEVAEAAACLVRSVIQACIFNDPVKTILAVIEMFKAVDGSSDILASLKARN
jgi:hypothetical protein